MTPFDQVRHSHPARHTSPVCLLVLGAGAAWCLVSSCTEPKPGSPAPPEATPAERRLEAAPPLNLAAALEAALATESSLQEPWFFRWPLSNIDTTSPYGIRMHPVVRRLLFHSGVDFRAPRGEPVVSAGPGEVVQAGELPLTGLTVTINHPGELQTLYAHLDELLVFEGQQVAAGAPIGLIGSTGRSTGPHLHFAAYRLLAGGRHPMDPTELVGQAVDPRNPPPPHIFPRPRPGKAIMESSHATP
ncbi:MAG: M23 family metallopeptidase [Polyangia bacterium]|jgi:murein DD-endopeptidase MepM/ murein hydrolase activator NlpD|nr:M23 family metallopeptidase [Polyangia bacterium]